MGKATGFTVSRRSQTTKISILALVLAPFLSAADHRSTAVAQNTTGAAWTPGDLVDVENGKFRCPETLRTLAEKRQEMERFLVWTKKRYPRWTIAQITTFRVAVLENRGCTRTLDNIRGGSD